MKRWTNGLPGATKGLGANLALRGLSVSQSGCARIPMMARSKIAPLQRPNTLMQLSRSSVLELPLATRGRAIHLARLYGPAVRCKSDLRIWRRLVLRFCIRPLNGTFVFLAIMDIRARPISFSERP